MKKKEIDGLLCAISEGDNGAFERLYEQTKRGVYSFLWSYLGNREDVEDALQTTYLKVKKNIAFYRAGTNGNAWLLQIAKNVALNELKARKRNAGEIPADAAAEDAFYASEVQNSVLSVVNRVLDEEEKRIVVLHVVWGYKHKEIASLLGCPTGTVTSKYKRAADKIRKAWKEERQ